MTEKIINKSKPKQEQLSGMEAHDFILEHVNKKNFKKQENIIGFDNYNEFADHNEEIVGNQNNSSHRFLYKLCEKIKSKQIQIHNCKENHTTSVYYNKEGVLVITSVLKKESK